ncbi:TPA: hypothetical protein BOS_23529 [Bos taurus]|nr:TPA: hypothetical protein BOS_23529 [Bos taurus]
MGSCAGEEGVAPPIPPLRPCDQFHLFVSYSSVDAVWTHRLTGRLEAELPGLNGKALLTLDCINRDSLPSWKVGSFSTLAVPDPLKEVLEDPELYKQAVGILNGVRSPRSCLRYLGCRIILAIVLILLSVVSVFLPLVLGLQELQPARRFLVISANAFFCPFFMILSINTLCWLRRSSKKTLRELACRVGEANLLLAPHSVLMGCETKNKLYFVYVLLGDCKQTFLGAPDGEAAFQEAILRFASSYACCLAHSHFPHWEEAAGAPGHLEVGPCFCQFVSLQLRRLGGVGWACLGPPRPLWSGGVRRGLASPSPLPPEAGFSSVHPVTPRKNGLGVGTAGRHLRALAEPRGPIALRAARKRDSGPGPRGAYTPRQDRRGVQWASVSALASVYRSAAECGADKGSAKPRVVSWLHSHSDRVALQSIKRSPGRQPQSLSAKPWQTGKKKGSLSLQEAEIFHHEVAHLCNKKEKTFKRAIPRIGLSQACGKPQPLLDGYQDPCPPRHSLDPGLPRVTLPAVASQPHYQHQWLEAGGHPGVESSRWKQEERTPSAQHSTPTPTLGRRGGSKRELPAGARSQGSQRVRFRATAATGAGGVGRCGGLRLRGPHCGAGGGVLPANFCAASFSSCSEASPGGFPEGFPVGFLEGSVTAAAAAARACALDAFLGPSLKAW